MAGLDEAEELTGLLHTGVRKFDPGVEGTTMDIKEGKDKSKALDRRTARLHRRQTRRRAARQREMFHALQAAGMMPLGKSGARASMVERNTLLKYAGSRTDPKVLLYSTDSRRSSSLCTNAPLPPA